MIVYNCHYQISNKYFDILQGHTVYLDFEEKSKLTMCFEVTDNKISKSSVDMKSRYQDSLPYKAGI